MNVPRAMCFGFVLCAVSMAEGEAYARRGVPFLITHGEVVRKVADIPAEHAEGVALAIGEPGAAVGQKYDQFGVFFLEIWTWEPEHCLFKDDTFWEVPPATLASMLDVEENELPNSWRYKFPPGMILLAVIGGLVVSVVIWGKSDEQKARERFESLMADDRYRRALDIMQERSRAEAENTAAENATTEDAEPNEGAESADATEATGESGDGPSGEPSDGGFGEAVDHLVEQGIDRSEAETNLAFLVQVLVAASQQEADGDA